jgi:hypothetical protein
LISGSVDAVSTIEVISARTAIKEIIVTATK